MTRKLLVVTGFLLASLDVSTVIATSEEGATADASMVPVVEGGSCVLLTVYLGVDREGESRFVEPYVEFSIAEPPSDRETEFTAYTVESPPIGTVELARMTAVSSWEITPMDHEKGFGSYVRLYLPHDISGLAGTDGKLRILIHSNSISVVDLLGGVDAARLVDATVSTAIDRSVE